jgi:hypothetical protein
MKYSLTVEPNGNQAANMASVGFRGPPSLLSDHEATSPKFDRGESTQPK